MKVAVIGGIGSGKSTLCRMLREMGKTVLDCDRIYDEVCRQPDYIRAIKQTFGTVQGGEIDRKALAGLVFSDAENMQRLNALAHPRVRALLEQKTQGLQECYVEVSAYYGSGLEGWFDYVIYADCPDDIRVRRVMQRGLSEQEATRRVQAQTDAATLRACADVVIDTSVSEEQTRALLTTLVRDIDKSRQS